MDIFPTWPWLKQSARRNVKMYDEAGGGGCVTPKCFTTNTLTAIRLLAAGLFGLLYNVQVLRSGEKVVGEEVRRRKRRRACSATDQVCLLALMA